MAQAALVERVIEDGKRTLAALDAAGLQITGALWLLDAERDEWSLILETPLVETLGPLALYKRIREVIAATPAIETVSTRDISVRGPSDRFLKLLHDEHPTGPGIVALRLRRDVVRGTFIDDALVYRLA